MLLSMTGLLAACGGKGTSDVTSGDDTYRVVEPEGFVYGISGLAAKKTYRTLIYFESAIPNLNYMGTSEAADAQHFANFVDGLLTHNEFGVLEKNLATKVEVNDDNTVFKFTIRDNVPWVRYDGSQYEAVEDGVSKKQFVKPSDWLASAKAILTAQNGSSLEYLISDFVMGAAEYYYYTDMMYKIATNNTFKKQYSTDAKKASYINSQIKTNKENLYNIYYKDNPIGADDLAAIGNLSRLGIKTNDEEMTLEYQLIQGAYYFPTLMTYSCYLPVNQYFLADKHYSSFGVRNDDILYNGPFLFTHEGDDEVIYSKNESYWNKDIVHVDQIVYTVYDNKIGNDYTRTQYFNGNIDGFGLSPQVTVGWKMFVTGDNNEGDVYNPVSGDVNARLLDTIGSMYGSNIVMNRTKSTAKKSFASKATSTSVANTELALSLEPVRRAFLNALDYDTYYCMYGKEEPFKSQYKVNTYTPKNFVQSTNGDYITNHYYDVYASKKGIPTGTKAGDGAHVDPETQQLVAEEGSAAWKLENGRIDRCQVSDADVRALAQNAMAAVDAFNANSEINGGKQISKPIYVEYYTLWEVDTEGTTKEVDTASILKMKQRLNGTTSENVADFKDFYVIPTDKVDQNSSDELSHNANFDYAPVLWGWGADYGDPLTYMNTYIKGGDWKSIFPFIGEDTVDNYFFDASTNTLSKTDLLDEYTRKVKEAAAITDDINARYTKFAECEYMLMEELSIYMPQINYGQGWSLSISKAAGYHMPTSNYGLSSDRMTGLWVLEQALTREERNAVRAKQEAAKAAYLASHPAIDIY